MRNLTASISVSAMLSLSAGAQIQQAQPSLIDGKLVFPEGAQIPRSLTPIEREYLKTHPLVPESGGPRGTFGVNPTGPVRCPGEYEPCDGIIIAWESFTPILSQIARFVTTTGNADIYVVLDTASEQASAQASIQAAGANMARVRWLVRTTDTVWMRDYGPRYIYEGTCRAIIDHTYNRPRPNDDVFPAFFANTKRHARYSIPLIHGGGNFHLNGEGESFVTRLINNENPGRTEQQIHDLWQTYQNVDTTFFTPFNTSVDLTQHIDMWVQVTGPSSAVVSDWPSPAGQFQIDADAICDSAAATLQSRGYTVHRTPAFGIGGVHYTYTNVVMCNDLILVPTYTNVSVSPSNAGALATWQAAMPTKTIVPVDCQAIVGSAGVMHCIVMHVPRAMNAPNPSVYLRNVRGGQSFYAGDSVNIQWISDDDVLVTGIDILLSTDGGATFPTTIAAQTADDGSFVWTVPDLVSSQARIRLVARDADTNIGSDQSDTDITLRGLPPCPGDFNGDHQATPQDIFDFLAAFFANLPSANVNGDAGVTSQDLFDYLAFWFAGCD